MALWGGEQTGDKLVAGEPEMPAYNTRVQIHHDAGRWRAGVEEHCVRSEEQVTRSG